MQKKSKLSQITKNQSSKIFLISDEQSINKNSHVTSKVDLLDELKAQKSEELIEDSTMTGLTREVSLQKIVSKLSDFKLNGTFNNNLSKI